MHRWLVLAAVALGACGGDDDDSPTCDNVEDGDCPAMCPADPDCTEPPDTDGGMMMMDDNGVSGDEIYDESCLSSPSCGAGTLETACVCVPEPRTPPPAMPDLFDIKRVGCGQLSAGGDGMRTPEDDFCDGDASRADAVVGCNMSEGYREATESQSITVYGVVDVFGNGGDADQITVEIYEEGSDGQLGEMLGSATASTGDPCVESEDEIDNDMVIGTRQLGFYAIPNIPSDTPLIIKTSGNANFWNDIYSYNVQATADELEMGEISSGSTECDEALNGSADFMDTPRWRYRARILSSSDWTSIPLTAGLVELVRPGSGAVAGEVHDCEDVRLEFAQVATNPPAQVLTYFTDNPDNPLPAPSRTEGTSLLGLYAALDIPEGPVDVAALGRVGDDVMTLGWYRARVFANAVTTVTLRGLRAQQVPQAEE